MSPRLFGRIALSVVVPAVLAGGLWQLNQHDKERSARAAEDWRRLNSANVIDPQVRIAWIAALDKALDERVIRYGNWIQFKGYTDIVYVPKQQVIVVCSPTDGIYLVAGGFEVSGSGAEATGGAIYELQLVALRSSIWEDQPPPLAPRLDIGPRSPAARELMDELCLTTITELGLTK